MGACAQPARGVRQAAPHTGPAFDDTVNNNPCGEYTVTSVNGVDVSAHGLCLFHLGMKLGLAAIQGPIVTSTS